MKVTHSFDSSEIPRGSSWSWLASGDVIRFLPIMLFTNCDSSTQIADSCRGPVTKQQRNLNLQLNVMFTICLWQQEVVGLSITFTGKFMIQDYEIGHWVSKSHERETGQRNTTHVSQLSHATGKQTLRSLSLSYQKRVGGTPKEGLECGVPPILLFVWHRL